MKENLSGQIAPGGGERFRLARGEPVRPERPGPPAQTLLECGKEDPVLQPRRLSGIHPEGLEFLPGRSALALEQAPRLPQEETLLPPADAREVDPVGSETVRLRERGFG